MGQESPRHEGGHAQKDHDGQKNQDDQKKAGEEGGVGDMIHIRGHTTDFSQKVESLEVNHAPLTEVGPNTDFGLERWSSTRASTTSYTRCGRSAAGRTWAADPHDRFHEAAKFPRSRFGRLASQASVLRLVS
jgi:hypothetical protein